MIRPDELRSIRDGEIDLAFRRWDRPRVKVGTRMRTAVGLVEVTSVEQVAPSRLTADDARRAGAASVASLREALDSLKADHAFLLKGGVFTEDQIESYMDLKWPEVARWEMTPAPVEFDMYYSS
jgi:hypothetical protein